MNEQLVAAATKPACRTSTVLPELPPFFAHIIDRALAFDKAKRWDNAAEMLDAIREASAATVVAPQTQTPVAIPTMAAHPRMSQLRSYPEVETGGASISGTRSMPGSARVGTAALIASPAPTTASSMAVGRTVSAIKTTSRPGIPKPVLAAVGGGGLFLATFVVVLAIHWMGDGDIDAPPLLAIESASVATPRSETATTPPPSHPVGGPTTSAQQPAQVEILAVGGPCLVNMDGLELGETPLVHEVTPGEHEVKCKTGSLVQTQDLVAELGGSHRITFLVKEGIAHDTPAKPPKPDVAKPPRPLDPLDIR